MVSDGEDNPVRTLAAAWEAATGVVAEWAEQTAAVAREAIHKLASDPAIRAAVEGWRTTRSGPGRTAAACATEHTRTTQGYVTTTR